MGFTIAAGFSHDCELIHQATERLAQGRELDWEPVRASSESVDDFWWELFGEDYLDEFKEGFEAGAGLYCP